MGFVRRHLLDRRWAFWLIAVALLARALLPAGTMLDSRDGRISVELCTGAGPMKMTVAVPAATRHEGDREHRPDTPCAFSSLWAPALAGADQILLAAAIAFIIAAVPSRAAIVAVHAPAFLRPPLRGPPAVY